MPVAVLRRRPKPPAPRAPPRRAAVLAGAAVALAALLPSPARADPIRLGHEFAVNSYTAYVQRRTDVGAAADGSFVVAWRSTQWKPADYERAIVAQRFDAQGRPQGGEFLVNTETYGAQDEPTVATAADGSFVVVWESYPGYYHMAGRRFSSTGGPLGAEFRVNSSAGFTYYTSSVATSPDGSFVVVWSHVSYADGSVGDGSGIAVLGRRFDADGTPQGEDFVVNTYSTGYQQDPAVARMPDGSFVVVWQDDERNAVVGRRYDGSGAAQGGEFLVSQSPTSFAGPTVAGAPGEGFVVVWTAGDVLARRYDGDGVAQGGEFVVDGTTLGNQYRADVTMAADGRFVVTWIDGAGVFARRFDATGAPEAGEFQVNQIRGAEDAYRNAVAVSGPGDGSFVVTWVTDEGDYSSTDIAGARFGVGSVGCPPAAATTCRETTVARRGVLRFKDVANDERDALTWQWVRGAATSGEEMGDPFAGTAYAVCLYDASGASQPILHMESPAAGPCAQVQCWRPFNAGVVEYFDREHLARGLERLRLSPGTAGRARVFVTARGPRLDLPAVPLVAPVVMQLHGSNGSCWSSTYAGGILRNGDGQFRARPDAATP